MQNTSIISTKELQDNLSEILGKVADDKQTFIVQKSGKKKVLLSPIEKVQKNIAGNVDFGKLPAFGIWKDRKDIQDSASWVSDARMKQSMRKI